MLLIIKEAILLTFRNNPDVINSVQRVVSKFSP